MFYQAFFFLFFKLAKNEDGPEFTFLDSLKFNREGKEEVFSVFSNGSMSSLNIALFVFRYPCFSVHLCSAIALSFLLLLSVIPGESDHVSYMTDRSGCSIYPLYDALGHLCVVLTIQGFFLMSDP